MNDQDQARAEPGSADPCSIAAWLSAALRKERAKLEASAVKGEFVPSLQRAPWAGYVAAGCFLAGQGLRGLLHVDAGEAREGSSLRDLFDCLVQDRREDLQAAYDKRGNRAHGDLGGFLDRMDGSWVWVGWMPEEGDCLLDESVKKLHFLVDDCIALLYSGRSEKALQAEDEVALAAALEGDSLEGLEEGFDESFGDDFDEGLPLPEEHEEDKRPFWEDEEDEDGSFPRSRGFAARISGEGAFLEMSADLRESFERRWREQEEKLDKVLRKTAKAVDKGNKRWLKLAKKAIKRRSGS